VPRYSKKWWDKAKQFKVEFINISDVDELLDKCRNDEEKVAVILLYYTGARPGELCMLLVRGFRVAKDDETGEDLLAISIPTTKRGVGRTIFLPINKHISFLLSWLNGLSKEERFVLPSFKKYWQLRNLIYRVSDNQLTQYFFRHNRFSKLAMKGASPETIKYFKGAKKMNSVTDYIHIGGLKTKSLAKLID
jgi:integrase